MVSLISTAAGFYMERVYLQNICLGFSLEYNMCVVRSSISNRQHCRLSICTESEMSLSNFLKEEISSTFKLMLHKWNYVSLNTKSALSADFYSTLLKVLIANL